MARRPPPGPSLFGDAVMAPVEKAKVESPPPPPPAPGPMTRGLPPAAHPSAGPVSVSKAQQTEDPENAAFEEFERELDAEERPNLRVVPPPAAVPEEEVIVERQDDGRYCVSLLRHYGTTCAAVIYTRRQLEMLQRRIGGALEVG